MLTDDLFDGIQILTPQELESSLNENKEGEEKEQQEEIVIAPIVEQITKVDKVESTDTTPDTEVKYKALMKELVTAGILSVEDVEKLEELPGTFDSIKKLMEETVDSKFKTKEENWKKSLPSAKKRFLEIEDAFDETEKAIVMAQRLEFFENLSEDKVVGNVDLQKQLYFEQLKSKNFSDADATEAVEDAIATNKLEAKALKAIPELKQDSLEIVNKAKEAKELQVKQAVESQTKAFETLVNTIETRESFVDGLPLNKVAKDKLKANMINPVHKDESGKEYNSLMYKQKQNPTEFEMLINYYDTLGLFDMDKDGKFKPNITKLKTTAKTQAINELDKVIAAEEQRGVGRNTSVETSKKTENILTLLERATSGK
jgi:hypothetical protein